MWICVRLFTLIVALAPEIEYAHDRDAVGILEQLRRICIPSTCQENNGRGEPKELD